MRPSPVFTESTGDAVDIVRLAAVTPSGPAASLDAVRAAVERDVRSAAAYAAAKAEADRLAAAPTDQLLALAAAAGHPADRHPAAVGPGHDRRPRRPAAGRRRRRRS